MAAFAIDLDIQGAAALSRLWERAPDITREELLRTTTEADLLLKREVKERTPVGVGGGGGLRGSITSSETALADRVIGIVGSPLNYATAVELGTKPHFLPVEALQDWVRQKLGVKKKKEVKRVAFAVARKIAHHGTEGAHMFRDAFEAKRGPIAQMYDAAVARIVRRLGEAGA